MYLSPDQSSPRELYHLLIGLINPRPIAWVSTCNAEGISNLAPYSFFNGVCASPPTLLFCPANTRDGEKKDTLRNIEDTGEFVVNVVSEKLGQVMSDTSAALPHGESEFLACGVREAPSRHVRPPRVADSPAAMECRLREIVRVGRGPLAGNVVIGNILAFHLDDAVLDPDGRPDPARLQTIGRMGGAGYTRTGDRYEISRP